MVAVLGRGDGLRYCGVADTGRGGDDFPRRYGRSHLADLSLAHVVDLVPVASPGTHYRAHAPTGPLYCRLLRHRVGGRPLAPPRAPLAALAPCFGTRCYHFAVFAPLLSRH